MPTADSESSRYFYRLGQFGPVRRDAALYLMYHKVGPPRFGWKGKGICHYVHTGLFRKQMRELAVAGYETAMPGVTADGESGKKLVVTFDDGYENVLLNGLPALSDVGFSSIIYLVHDRIGGMNEWDAGSGIRMERLMGRGQIREWLAAGQEIGSHTLTHPFLTKLSPDRAREEIFASKKRLEDLFGREIEHFCYPYGDSSPAVRDLVREAGYKTACSLKTGWNQAGAMPFDLRRFMARYPKWSLRDWLAVSA